MQGRLCALLCFSLIACSAFAGQRVRLRLGVKNDGLGGITCVYLDDVTLYVS